MRNKYIKHTLIISCCLFWLTTIAKAQNDATIINEKIHVGYNYALDPLKRGKFVLSTSYNGLKYSFEEIGIGMGYRGNEGYGYIYSQYSLAVEANRINNKNIFGPKISYSTSLAFLYLSGSIIYYSDFTNSKFCFRPEIGPTFLGGISLCYGYNIGLNKSDFPINDHSIALKIVIGKACWRNIF